MGIGIPRRVAHGVGRLLLVIRGRTEGGAARLLQMARSQVGDGASRTGGGEQRPSPMEAGAERLLLAIPADGEIAVERDGAIHRAGDGARTKQVVGGVRLASLMEDG